MGNPGLQGDFTRRGDSMRHLIIGNGPAGVMAAEMIRKHAPCDPIVLLGNEPGPSYSRTLLPRMVSGDASEAACYLRKESDHFYKLRIEQRFARVSRIDARARMAVTEEGATFGYDRLLIATGARARIPKIPGIHSPGVRACWTLQDARKLVELAQPNAQVIVIGAGLVGCVLLESLIMRRVRLVVIEQAAHMASSMMKAGAARMLKRWCESKEIQVRTSTSVTAIDNIGRTSRGPHLAARLSNGERLAADLIIYATGAQPDLSFLQGSGIDCARGILVNPSMQTNLPGIYAAGDCAEAFDVETGRMMIAGVLPNALDQACCAALNMVGKSACQQRIRRISMLSTMGLVATSLGEWRGLPGGQWVEASDERSYKHLRLEFRKDVLIGANAIGLRDYVGMLRDLIQHQVGLGEWKDRLLRDPTRLKEAYRACVLRHGCMDDGLATRDVTRAASPGAMRGSASSETIAAIAYRTIANAARRSPPTPSGNPL